MQEAYYALYAPGLRAGERCLARAGGAISTPPLPVRNQRYAPPHQMMMDCRWRITASA
jgi:hypothetical protein